MRKGSTRRTTMRHSTPHFSQISAPALASGQDHAWQLGIVHRWICLLSSLLLALGLAYAVYSQGELLFSHSSSEPVASMRAPTAAEGIAETAPDGEPMAGGIQKAVASEIPSDNRPIWQRHLTCPGPIVKGMSKWLHWFCVPEGDTFSLMGPDGNAVNPDSLGQVHGGGPAMYSFRALLSGTYKLKLGSQAEPTSFHLHAEECVCPRAFADFATAYECKAEDLERVRQMLARWPDKSVTRAMMTRFLLEEEEVYQVTVKDNKLWSMDFRGRSGARRARDPGFWPWGTIHDLVHSVLRKVKIPDCEFFINAGNRPRLLRSKGGGAPVVLSYNMRSTHFDIPVPSDQMILNVRELKALKMACKSPAWENRTALAYFRGHNSEIERNPLMKTEQTLFRTRFKAAMISNDRPDLLDVKINAKLRPFIEDRVKKHVDEMNLTTTAWDEEEVGVLYKYYLNLDGLAAPYRSSWVLPSGSLMVKQASPFSEWWYPKMKAGEQYLEVDNSLHDLVQALEWARSHEAQAREISERGFQFWAEHLQGEALLCWTAAVLHGIGAKLAFEPSTRAKEFVSGQQSWQERLARYPGGHSDKGMTEASQLDPPAECVCPS